MTAQQINKKLVRCGDGMLAMYCAGCKKPHYFVTEGPQSWGFNGNYDSPSFVHSFRECLPARKGRDNKMLPAVHICHFLLRNGKVQFLVDCEHELADSTIDLPDIPQSFIDNWDGWFKRTP